MLNIAVQNLIVTFNCLLKCI